MPGNRRKTRTGCTQCKRRRVKCDEKKPSCANCERNYLQCSLEFLTPINYFSRSASTVNHSVQTLAKPAPTWSYPFTPSVNMELSAYPFDARTRELLHHYTTVVYKSFSGNRKPSLWCIVMPQMGLAHPFLLSGILAISALHLSTVLPHRKHELQTLAVTLECAALPSFQICMRKPTSETIHAIFAFAGSVVPYIMASSDVLYTGEKSGRCRLPHKDDDQPHWFQVMRGMMVLLSSHWQELKNGPIAPLLREDPGQNYASENLDDEQLARLDGMFPKSSLLSSPILHRPSLFGSSPASTFLRGEKNFNVCRTALKELRSVFALPRSFTRTLCIRTSIPLWAGRVNQDFMELIYERDPRALIIMAHYCVLLKRNNHVWYLSGLGTGMLENIWEALGEEWTPWIQWAIDQPVS